MFISRNNIFITAVVVVMMMIMMMARMAKVQCNWGPIPCFQEQLYYVGAVTVIFPVMMIDDKTHARSSLI